MFNRTEGAYIGYVTEGLEAANANSYGTNPLSVGTQGADVWRKTPASPTDSICYP